MIIRIVKLSFHPEHIPAFLENFGQMKEKIRNSHGNRFLELYRDVENTDVFFTYSHWDSDADLQAYRESELFYDVWSFTKKLFNAKPEAWSVERLVSLA
ncbi:MAG: antibiotic biosynthesis monooxygenase [Flavobacterium sp.]|nr:MAG: antibiotic biosynthesis monooxygenase [Flavobacterium sp.]